MFQTQPHFISVVIATFNRCQSLKDTLDSLLRQEIDGSFDYEIIVVDNNSGDATKDVVLSYGDQFNGRLRYLFEPKQGKSYALNKGSNEAKGHLLAYTDDDCILDDKWLKNIAAAFKKHSVDVLTGKVIPRLESPKPDWLDWNNKIFWGAYVYYDLGGAYLENTKEMIFPPGANMIFNRKSHERFGGFKRPTRAEDTEICYEWQKQGAKIGYDPGIVVYHVTPDSRLNKNYVRKWQFLCGKNTATIFKDEYKEAKRTLFGAPLWTYKRVMQSIIRYLKGLVMFRRDNFVNELRIHYQLGVMARYRGKRCYFENLR